MMNKILIGFNLILAVAVAYLFFRSPETAAKPDEMPETPIEEQVAEKPVKKTIPDSGSFLTGKIAYVNIDRLNEESLEISDLIAETKRRKNNIESSVEQLSIEYQKKLQEYENSAKAGIAPPSVLQAKEKEIIALEKEAQNKQLQMDNLTMDINDKNLAFQKRVKDFLEKWNEGRYDYILSYSDAVPSMLFGRSSLEVTDEVIAGLNREYKDRKRKPGK